MALKDEIQDGIVIKNHPIYWFDDGSLILDVETHRFKVHYTLITRHSKFFSAVTSSSKDPTENSEDITTGNGSDKDFVAGGTSLSHVVLEPKGEVKPEDIEALLQHLYHDVWSTGTYDNCCGCLDEEASFSHTISLLRVSSPQQLDFPSVHAAARRRFEASFPRNPEEFTHDHPLYDALPIAQALNLPLVMKAIFYSLVSTTDFDVFATSSDLDSQTKDPITTQSSYDLCLDERGSGQNVPEKISAPRVLSSKDAQTCLNLMNRLIDHFTPILFTPPATSHMECTDVFAETWMTLVIQPAIDNDGVYKPLETLQRTKEIDWVKHGMCPSCVADKIEEWSEEQRSIWKLMDEWLGLSSQVKSSS